MKQRSGANGALSTDRSTWIAGSYLGTCINGLRPDQDCDNTVKRRWLFWGLAKGLQQSGIKCKCIFSRSCGVTNVCTSMPYRCRVDTLRAKVMGGMNPKESSRGRHKHSPASCAVLQAKQGKHQKAKQPSKKNHTCLQTWKGYMVVLSMKVYCIVHYECLYKALWNMSLMFRIMYGNSSGG